jgi:hypothetical protein
MGRFFEGLLRKLWMPKNSREEIWCNEKCAKVHEETSVRANNNKKFMEKKFREESQVSNFARGYFTRGGFTSGGFARGCFARGDFSR